MNRRRLLGTAGTLALASLAGCLDSFQEHFVGEVGVPIPIELTNEGDQTYNVQVDAYDLATDRETYDQGFSIRPQENVKPANLEGAEQQVRVTRFGDEDLVETGTVTPDTRLVRVVVDDESLTLDIRVREAEGDAGNETDDGNRSSEGDGSRSD